MARREILPTQPATKCLIAKCLLDLRKNERRISRRLISIFQFRVLPPEGVLNILFTDAKVVEVKCTRPDVTRKKLEFRNVELDIGPTYYLWQTGCGWVPSPQSFPTNDNTTFFFSHNSKQRHAIHGSCERFSAPCKKKYHFKIRNFKPI